MNDTTELARGLGSVEAKVDQLIKIANEINGKVSNHEERIGSLETNRRILRAVWAGFVSLLTFLGIKKG